MASPASESRSASRRQRAARTRRRLWETSNSVTGTENRLGVIERLICDLHHSWFGQRFVARGNPDYFGNGPGPAVSSETCSVSVVLDPVEAGFLQQPAADEVPDIDAIRMAALHSIDLDELAPAVSRLEGYAENLVKTLRADILVWPPVLGKSEEEGRAVITEMVCSQAGDTLQHAFAQGGASLSKSQLETVKMRIEQSTARALDDWKRSVGTLEANFDE